MERTHWIRSNSSKAVITDIPSSTDSIHLEVVAAAVTLNSTSVDSDLSELLDGFIVQLTIIDTFAPIGAT